jgi:hypothetical protein
MVTFVIAGRPRSSSRSDHIGICRLDHPGDQASGMTNPTSPDIFQRRTRRKRRPRIRRRPQGTQG